MYYYRNTYIETETFSKPLSLKLKRLETFKMGFIPIATLYYLNLQYTLDYIRFKSQFSDVQFKELYSEYMIY